MSELLNLGTDGRLRCWWPGDLEDYTIYHDEEWGRPTLADDELFEKICLEGFQAGLSWLTILRKRENFRAAFEQFDFVKVAEFDERDVERLLQNAGIIRHRGKIEATINNAARAIEMVDEFGSVKNYVWEWRPTEREPDLKDPSLLISNQTATSAALSKDLKKRGWKFFGPTTAYAFMQAMGLVNDHVEGCEWHAICAAEQAAV